MSRVGFIGLGTMGRHMARNLMKAGHPLTFFARRPEVAAEFVQAGAVQAANPAEVARASDVIITIVTADAQVTEVVAGPAGIAEGAAPGKLLIDMSTIGPDTVRRLAERLRAVGMDMLDAPVSGGPWGAEAGTLTIMVGGEASLFERARPMLEAMGKKIFHVGPLAAGQTVKLVNQMVGGGIMALIAEGFVLCKKAGVDVEILNDVMLVCSANSSVLEARGKKFVLANQFVPGFMTELMRKDMALAIEMAQRLNVPTPVAGSALQQYTAAMNLGHSKADFSAVVKVCEQAAGVDLRSKISDL